MSTRSAIIHKTATGFAGIYCHFDGYPSGVGAELLENWKDSDKVSELISLGDISSLGSDAQKTTAYMRDRDETGCEPKIGVTSEAVAKMIGHNGHVYVFENGSWTHNGEELASAVDQDS